MLYDRKEYARAIEDYSNAIKLNPKTWFYYFNRGLAYYYSGQYLLAIPEYDKVIEMNPEYDMVYYNKGREFFRSRQFGKALKEFEYYWENYRNKLDNNGSV